MFVWDMAFFLEIAGVGYGINIALDKAIMIRG